MSVLEPMSTAGILARPEALAGWLRFRWLVRPRRVLLLLAAIWVLNVFDLGFTLVEASRHHFVEMNPVAALLIHAPPIVLVSYKVALVVIGSALLLRFSWHSTTEWACWLLLSAYLYVGFRWGLYYSDLLETLNDPAMTVPFR